MNLSGFNHLFSPHHCVGFLFFALHPPLRDRPPPRLTTQLITSNSSCTTHSHHSFHTTHHIHSSYTTHHIYSSYTTDLTPPSHPFILHHSSHTTHHIDSSHTTHHIPFILHNSSHPLMSTSHTQHIFTTHQSADFAAGES